MQLDRKVSGFYVHMSDMCSSAGEEKPYTLLTTQRRLLQEVDVDSLRNGVVYNLRRNKWMAERVLAKYTIDHRAGGEGHRQRNV